MTDLAERLLTAINDREARINRAREWMGPMFQVNELTERGYKVKSEPCWVDIAGERIWDADVELRRCAADRKIVATAVVDLSVSAQLLDRFAEGASSSARQLLWHLAEGYGITEEAPDHG